MELNRRNVLKSAVAFSLFGGLTLAGCSNNTPSQSQSSSSSGQTGTAAGSLTLDNTAWSYDSTNDVYYQLGLSYVAWVCPVNGVWDPAVFIRGWFSRIVR